MPSTHLLCLFKQLVPIITPHLIAARACPLTITRPRVLASQFVFNDSRHGNGVLRSHRSVWHHWLRHGISWCCYPSRLLRLFVFTDEKVPLGKRKTVVCVCVCKGVRKLHQWNGSPWTWLATKPCVAEGADDAPVLLEDCARSGRVLKSRVSDSAAIVEAGADGRETLRDNAPQQHSVPSAFFFFEQKKALSLISQAHQ